MAESNNGYPVIRTYRTTGALPRLRMWRIPGTQIYFTARDGCLGFLLIHYATWYHRRIEPLNGKVRDDWGWNPRLIAGTFVWSNHASGTALDLNSIKHPLGARGTFMFKVRRIAARTRIRRRIERKYKSLIWSGEFYKNRPDPMHVENAASRYFADSERLARRLMRTKIGRDILAANPGADKVIIS